MDFNDYVNKLNKLNRQDLGYESENCCLPASETILFFKTLTAKFRQYRMPRLSTSKV
jgi:hypothetical protein